MSRQDRKTESVVTPKISPERTRSKLLQILNDGEFHSGEALASKFGLSRSAISNHIKALNELGLDIFSVKGRGYQLNGEIELMSAEAIAASLRDKCEPSEQHKLNIQNRVLIENVVTSTNDVIKQAANTTPRKASGYCCIAEAQTAGRGRRGRQWISPFGASLYLSMLWQFEDGYQAMSGLSLMVGVVLNQTLCELGIDACKLKWPNDVYYKQQKLAGILIEVEGLVDGGVSAIIGIGLNMKLPEHVSGIDQAFTDLRSVCMDSQKRSISRNTFAAMLMSNLWEALPIFEQQGLKPFLSSWQKADLYVDKPVKLMAGKNEIHGISRGVNASGALLLEIKEATAGRISPKIEAFHGGEISVRPV